MPSLRNLSYRLLQMEKLAESLTIDGLKPTKKKQIYLSKHEQELPRENERLQAVIIQLTQEDLELKKSTGIGIKTRFAKRTKTKSR